MGVVTPDRFISVAEQTGLIIELGDWILEDACRHCLEWNRESVREVPVAVNVSAVQLRQPTFEDSVLRILDRTSLPPSLLELEVTESVAVDAIALSSLTSLGKRGVRLAVDDFGTGFCSLQYLNTLPVDKLKISAEFVQSSRASAALEIFEAVAGLGKRLGLETVAEGVETRAQLEVARWARCDSAQGFLWGRPSSDILSLLSVKRHSRLEEPGRWRSSGGCREGRIPR